MASHGAPIQSPMGPQRALRGRKGARHLLRFILCFGKLRHRLNVAFTLQEQPMRHRGRPVKYLGVPNEPGLDAEERRQLLRRIANRESARRMRKRQLDELHYSSTEVGAKPPACTPATTILQLWLSGSCRSPCHHLCPPLLRGCMAPPSCGAAALIPCMNCSIIMQRASRTAQMWEHVHPLMLGGS